MDIIENAIDAVQKYASNFYLENSLPVVATIVENLDFATCVVNFVEYAEKNAIEVGEIKATLIHDVIGVHNKEPFFLPRVDSYRNVEV